MINPLWIALASLTLFLQPVQAQDNLVIAGTGDSQEILRLIAGQFNQSQQQVRVQIPDSIGSGGGVRGLARDRFPLARTARPVKDKEQTGNLIEHAFAYSPLVFASSASGSAPDNLATDDINRIYSGSINNWSAVGGKDAPIYPIDREAGDSSRSVLQKSLPGFSDIKSVAKVFFNTPDTVRAISDNNNTLGFMPYYLARNNELHIFSLDGIEVTAANVSEGRYPLVTTFYIISNGEPTGSAAAFLDYLYSPEVRETIERFGLLPADRGN